MEKSNTIHIGVTVDKSHATKTTGLVLRAFPKNSLMDAKISGRGNNGIAYLKKKTISKT